MEKNNKEGKMPQYRMWGRKMKERQWLDITPEAKKWVRGWIAVMDKDMNQKIVWHDQIDDTMLFYFPLPHSLTKEQFKKTNASKEIKVDWENNGFLVSQ